MSADEIGIAYNAVLAALDSACKKGAFNLTVAHQVFVVTDAVALYINQKIVTEKKLEKHNINMTNLLTARQVRPNVEEIYNALQVANQAGVYKIEDVIAAQAQYVKLRDGISQRCEIEERLEAEQTRKAEAEAKAAAEAKATADAKAAELAKATLNSSTPASLPADNVKA